MAGQKLTLVIEVDGATQTIADLRKIREAVGAAASPQIDTKGLDELLSKTLKLSDITQVADAYNEITGAIGSLQGKFQGVYDFLIGGNEKLKQQLLQSAATITATSQVVSNGIKIDDPTESIQRLQPLLTKAIQDVQVSTQQLVGVTSEQTSEVFNVILQNVGLLNNQLKGAGEGGKDLSNAIDAASSLAPGLVATLGTLGLPIGQASDEIGNLLKGEIDSTAQVAKSLGITREQIESFKAQGTLVKELNARFEPFLKANALASQSVAGLTSNIQDIFEIVGRTAGAPLLDTLVGQLNTVYQLLQNNQGQITQTVVDVVARITEVLGVAIASINEIAATLTPSLLAIGGALQDAFGAGAETAETTLQSLTGVTVALIQGLTPLIQLVTGLASGLADLASTPAGQALLQAALATVALNATIPALTGGLGSLVNASGKIFETFNNLIPILKEAGTAKSVLAAKEAILATVTGTTTAAQTAQAAATAILLTGTVAETEAALAAAAAEETKAAALQTSGKAMLASAAQAGLLAAAVAAIALVVQQFQELTARSSEAQQSIDRLSVQMDRVSELATKVKTAGGAVADPLKTNADIAAGNAERIKNNLSGITKALDLVRGTLQQTQKAGLAFLDGIADRIPVVGGLIKSLIDQTPRYRTGAEQAISDANSAASQVSQQIAGNIQDIDNLIKNQLSNKTQQALSNQLKTQQQQLQDINDQIAAAQKSGDTGRVEQLGREKAAIEANIVTTIGQKQAFVDLGQATTKSIDESIAALEKQKENVTSENAGLLPALDAQIDKFKKQKAAIEGITNAIDIQSPALINQGTLYQQLDRQAQQAFNTLYSAQKDAPDPTKDQAANSAKQITQFTGQQIELGRISRDEGLKRLQQVANDGRLELADRQAAIEAINKITQDGLDGQLAGYKQEQSEVEKLLAEGNITEQEAAKRRAEIQFNSANTRLENLQQQIEKEQAAIAAGTGSADRLQNLQQQEADAATGVAKARSDANKAGLDADLQVFKDQQAKVDQLQAEGVISDAEAQARKTQITVQETQKRLEAVRSQIAQELAEGKKVDGLKQQEAGLLTQLIQAQAAANKTAIDQQLQAIEKAQEDATATINQAQQQRQIQTQELLNKGVISQREADKLKLDSDRTRLDGELAAAQQHLASLQALPDPSDPDEKEAREKQIRSAISQTNQLQLQLLENEHQAQEAVHQAAVEAIKDEADRRQVASDQYKGKLEEESIAIQRQSSALDRQKAAQDAIASSLQQQSKLLQSRQGLQEAINNLAKTEAQIRIDGLSEGLSLTQRLATEQDAGVKAVIRARLQALGISGSEESIARQLADQRKKSAELELKQLAQKQAAERTSLQLQLQQEAAQARTAVIEAERNKLAAERQVLDAKKAVQDAADAKAAGQDALEAAQEITDPKERERAIRAANRQIASADRQSESAQLGLDNAQQGVGLADRQVAQARQAAVNQDAIAKNSLAALDAQQKSEVAVAKQKADSEIFAANLQVAEAAAKGIANALNGSGGNAGTGSLPQRRSGGDIAPGTLYQVHKDELFVSHTGGYMLNRADAMQVASAALSSGLPAPAVRSLSVGNSANPADLMILASLEQLNRNVALLDGGVKIGQLNQQVTNQVPRDAAAIAQMVERSSLDLLWQLKNKIRQG